MTSRIPDSTMQQTVPPALPAVLRATSGLTWRVCSLLFLTFSIVPLQGEKIRPLADDYVTVFSTPKPGEVFAYSPGIERLDSGRLIATLDLGGPGMDQWPEPKGIRYGKPVQGKVYTSDDGGKTWLHRVDFPFMHARPFQAGRSVYVLGQTGDLMIIRSDDGGKSWTEPRSLSEGKDWTQAPSNVHYANGCVYLTMNLRPYTHSGIWPASIEAPVLMRAKIEDDLTRTENWDFSSVLAFRDIVSPKDLDYFGVPFFRSEFDTSYQIAPGRSMSPIGWLETNVVQFVDPNHIWHDASGKTFHLWSRAHTGGTGYAAIAKVVEKGSQPGTGKMEVMLESAPSGKKMLYVPCPGGQMKFHVLYDEETELYWLLSSQATDSMTKPAQLPDNRYGLPNNERHRLVLHFSKNMIDWIFAGVVATGETPDQARHYASMDFDGQDLVILSRSGDRLAKNAHDGNIISFHRVKNFRDLVY
ncbi:MAG: sialidase family protein [Verrucomicrobia bacterium]|nr:sialidase family protein [Verrucomicrobiota bacterium]MDA1068966.1 sialidase family protein [Verrucomicrobiota bacterium]